MRVTLFTTVLGLLLAAGSFAQAQDKQDNRIYYEELRPENKIHFSDKTIKLELAGKLESIDYSDGVFILRENRGSDDWGHSKTVWHIVDTCGVFLAKSLDWDSYHFTLPVFENGYAINQNKGVTIIDKKAQVLCDLHESFAFCGDRFVDGLVLAAGKRTYNNGEGYHKVSYVGVDGKIKFPALTETVSQWDIYTGVPEVAPLKEGLRRHYQFSSRKYGFINAKGEYVAQPQFLAAHDFSEGLAAVKVATDDGEKWGFIDKTGKMVIGPKFRNEPGDFHDGYSVVTKNTGYKTFLKKDGSTLDYDCETLLDFNGGWSYLKFPQGQQYIINTDIQGYEVWASRSQIALFGMDVVKAIRDMDRPLFIDQNGIYEKYLIPILVPDYGWFSYFGDGLFWYENQAAGGESGVIRANGERVMVFRKSEW